MSRALWAACLVVALGCDRDVVRIGAPSDAASQLSAAMLVSELGDKRQALHLEACESVRACLARVRSGDLDIAVAPTSMIGVGIAVVGPTGITRTPRVVTSERAGDLNEFAGLRPRARVAIGRAFSQRARGGFAAVARAYGWGGAQRVFIESPTERLAALDEGRVDAAILDDALVVGDVQRLSDSRGALLPNALAFVVSDDDRLADDQSLRDAAVVTAERASASDRRSQLVAINAGRSARLVIRASEPDPLRVAVTASSTRIVRIATNAVARGLADRGVELLAVSDPAAAVADGRAELAITADEAVVAKVEAVVTFDDGRGVVATLWQRRDDGALDVKDAEALMAASTLARVPSARSMWSGAEETARAGRVASVQSEVLDSIVNVLVCGFVAWLLVSIFRRRSMPAWETTDDSD